MPSADDQVGPENEDWADATGVTSVSLKVEKGKMKNVALKHNTSCPIH